MSLVGSEPRKEMKSLLTRIRWFLLVSQGHASTHPQSDSYGDRYIFPHHRTAHIVQGRKSPRTRDITNMVNHYYVGRRFIAAL